MPADAATVLHLGAHKTASTHVQQTLGAGAAKLRAAGVVFRGPRALRAGRLRLAHVATTWKPAFWLRRRLAPEFRYLAAGAERVVLSEENVLGRALEARMLRTRRFYPGAAARVRRVIVALGIDHIHLCIAVRDPADFIVSAYCQDLFGGGHAGFAERVGDLDVTALRWSDLVERLRAVRGVDGVTVWRFEDYPANRATVFAALLGPEAAACGLPRIAARMQPGLSQAAHDEVLRWQAEGHVPDGHSSRALAARVAHPKGPDAPAFDPWPAAVRARSAASYGEDMARLSSLAGVRLVGLRPDAPGAHRAESA